MSISGNYPAPVTVNGFLCRNCTDVDYAKKHIDPQHPRSGPYNIDAKDDPTQPAAVRFGGKLSALNDAPPSTDAAAPDAPGANLDLSV
jgi:hypothetical protein